ncbi:MAG: DEAD/DEAH box helicase [Bacteroidales bacterium]
MESTTTTRQHSSVRVRRTRRPVRPASRQPQPVAPAHPELIFEPAPHDPTPIEFAALPLDARLRQGVADRGFERTTPVQSAVFPLVLSGSDVIACAQTGTGKTAAFLLPIMHRLLAARDSGVAQAGRTRVLVLAPTRELAVQIEDDLLGFAYHTKLSGAAVYGGVDSEPQAFALRNGADIVVATPGRLLDHLSTGVANFESVEFLVLDEADRMLDMGFWPDVRRIVSTLPEERQTLMFSATMSKDVTDLASQIMRQPKYVQLGEARGPASTITHVAHLVARTDKIDWLAGFLRRQPDPALVFVRTKRWADRLGERLAARGIRCTSLHADRSQSQRTAAVEGFKGGRYKVLIATDIAARGLDIDGIGHVINYEVPDTPDMYVHRVGRTGRADATGTALTLVAPEEMPALTLLEKSFDMRIERSES